MILPNSAARDRRLSFTARGILAHLLSLPDGAKEDVRTLADRNPGVGRRGVSKAVQELEDAGYYVRRNVRDEDGQVRTETAVYDVPQTEGYPVPASPGTGDPGIGNTGTLPTGVKDLVSKDLEKDPSLPSVSPVQTPAPPAAREGFQEIKGNQEHAPEAARLLARLEAVDARLRLSQRQIQALVPLASQWLQNGASVMEITDAVVQQLPSKVYAPAKLVADRLTRKLPAPRRAWKHFDATCRDCKRPFGGATPESGQCSECRGDVLPPALQTLAHPEPDPFVTGIAASIRSALSATRSAVASV
ncbi:helix-turn-helix domain-containing protein [Streptomyces netropsis]|uniref:helix-turn-helix domain-containing protein n=1 Tax=Streptomyces netropsis TaxID=55404 RepID=UPI0030D50106